MEHSAPNHSMLNLTTVLALGGAALVAGIVLAPYVAPAIGLGNLDTAESALMAMHNGATGSGLAGGLSEAISYIPLIGSELAKGGAFNIIATAVTGLGGVLLGNWMSKNHQGKEGIDWGKVVKWSALATSALIAMPSILAGISNGLAYIMQELVSNNVLQPEFGEKLVAGILSTIGVTAYQEPAKMGLTGAAVTLPHLLTCGFSMFPLAASIGANSMMEPDGLPPEDPNYAITPDEQALVARYNQASGGQKILLKKEILDKGYQPDFHADGTIHLYKHPESPASAAYAR